MSGYIARKGLLTVRNVRSQARIVQRANCSAIMGPFPIKIDELNQK